MLTSKREDSPQKLQQIKDPKLQQMKDEETEDIPLLYEKNENPNRNFPKILSNFSSNYRKRKREMKPSSLKSFSTNTEIKKKERRCGGVKEALWQKGT